MRLGRIKSSIVFLSVVALGLGACLSLRGSPDRTPARNPWSCSTPSLGAITLELYPDKAPITVENFLKYVDEGFYDNLIFHRVIPGFMVQGGGMTDQMVEKTAGTHGPIKNESGQRAVQRPRDLLPWPGRTTLIRPPASSSSTMRTTRTLDTYGGGYTVFGKVIDGMDVVDKIAKVSTTTRGPLRDVPIKPVYIKSAKRKTS